MSIEIRRYLKYKYGTSAKYADAENKSACIVQICSGWFHKYSSSGSQHCCISQYVVFYVKGHATLFRRHTFKSLMTTTPSRHCKLYYQYEEKEFAHYSLTVIHRLSVSSKYQKIFSINVWVGIVLRLF